MKKEALIFNIGVSHARMVELVYTVALEATAAMHESPNLSTSIDNGICHM